MYGPVCRSQFLSGTIQPVPFQRHGVSDFRKPTRGDMHLPSTAEFQLGKICLSLAWRFLRRAWLLGRGFFDRVPADLSFFGGGAVRLPYTWAYQTGKHTRAMHCRCHIYVVGVRAGRCLCIAMPLSISGYSEWEKMLSADICTMPAWPLVPMFSGCPNSVCQVIDSVDLVRDCAVCHSGRCSRGFLTC